MDARTASRAAEVTVGTLNSWVQRGLVPGMTVGAQGRARDFDVGVATGIGIICALVRHGLSAPRASKIAERYLKEEPRHNRLLLAPLNEIDNLRQNNIEIGVYHPFATEEELPAVLKRIQPLKLPSYIVLDVEHIKETMRAAEERWQQQQGRQEGRRA